MSENTKDLVNEFEFNSIEDVHQVLVHKFPDKVKLDERENYEGVIIDPTALEEVALFIRDDLKFPYLSSVTGVDYINEGLLESVYHTYGELGSALVFKAQVDRNNPEIPSLVSVWPSADFQERESYDLIGIRYVGHPNLQRILTWEGFHGHPLQKDWHEPYYEQDHKPFDSRHPEGHIYRAEDKNPYHKNVQYPAGFDPDTYEDISQTSVYEPLKKVSEEHGLATEPLVINLGPQHPSTHGVLRVVAAVDGETIIDLMPVFGYLHRNHEKIGERCTFPQIVPYTDRLDYICSMSNNLGYVLAVEKLTGVNPPERAEYIRVIMAELTRIVNHLLAIGFLWNDVGAFFTPVVYGFNERELILDLFEMASGSRMMCNYMRVGGVFEDLPDGWMDKAKALIFNRLPRFVEELDRLVVENEIFRARSIGVGILPPEKAVALGTSGPLLRGSGVPYDIRRIEPYSIYDRFDFDVAVRYNGDVYDRFMVRFDEMRQSLRILQQAVNQIPEGPIQTGKKNWTIKVPPGEAYARIEAPKGELGFYLVSDGSANPWRYHVRSTSIINLTSLAEMCRGHKIADVVVILGSIDITLGEVDR
ncbi:MAG: NADH-quinone oxidoreductase subunit D [Anaerolineales bacterium]|nr:NADH-quinone oxidoreductase subunit D [Anaerolineales bacterium]